MSEREEYTPPMEVLHDIYCGIYEPINPDVKRSSEQFNRAIATHDRALREQIAREILDEGCSYPGDMAGQFAEIYARIARGKDQTDE